jgi:signal transduction histidine kinase
MPAPRASGTDHGEVNIVRAYVIMRLVALLQPALAAAQSQPPRLSLAAGGALNAVLVLQSAVLIAAAVARRRVPPRWLTGLEAGVMVPELVAGAALSGPGHDGAWADLAYQFSLIAIVGVGLSFRRLSAVLVVTAGPATGYVLAHVLIRHEAPSSAVLDATQYLVHSSVAWLIGGAVRRSAGQLEAAHRTVTDREVELAGERERARHARVMHDRVLQVLEILTHGDLIADPALRGHVRAESAWLRSFVRGESPDAATDLPAALAVVARDMARSGLAVQLNSAQLAAALSGRGQPGPETIQALADAAREALVNVLKHAGTRSAVLHAGLDAGILTVSVLDHGRGFDHQLIQAGFGLEMSIRERIAAVGGEVLVESKPDTGTYVELRVPAPVSYE